MNDNIKELLPLLNEAKQKATILNDSDINYYKNHNLFSSLNLTKNEIISNILSLEKIIAENENCKREKDRCFLASNYHMGIKRNNKGKLYFYVHYCYKMLDIDNLLYFKKNFLYNYYRKSDISNVQLTKEYFNKSDESLQNIVDNYKKIRDISNSLGMYIYGNFGVGKTYLSFAMANDLAIKLNLKICFVFLPEYINLIKKSFNNEGDKEYIDELTNTFKEVDVLFFDDIGAEFSSEWFYIEYLLNILNQRMNNKKMTFFNSNLSLNELELSFKTKLKDISSKKSANRIMDRIRALVGNKEYLLKGKNQRY